MRAWWNSWKATSIEPKEGDGQDQGADPGHTGEEHGNGNGKGHAGDDGH